MVLSPVCTLEEFQVADITRESRSRAGKTVNDYHLESRDGVIRGKTNCLKLRIPEILSIAERLESGENLAHIHQDYQDKISITSMSETMKKYYVGLLNRVINQYTRLEKVGLTECQN